MNNPSTPPPGPSTPGGELQQINPAAWPTENGGQSEASGKQAPVQPPPPKPPKDILFGNANKANRR